ncbi:zinc transporter ZupT [Methanospirillum stamsii]|uniref:Zinc transporter ZupT n=1 Tax=Methanospirillum stamsii TaxID=1277351 RepID=A0A2V2NA94_9EURY|nr:zinc transporter ZupT [Methanospirillum stamsii]PWR74556.1 zinc transporter ZupT [Methanospirillum stamsii]
MPDMIIALFLTTLAGLSTAIGAMMVFVMKEPKKHFLSPALGFSAGVMIYISFVEMLPDTIEKVGEGMAIVAFFMGVMIFALIDFMIPKDYNPHNFFRVNNSKKEMGSETIGNSSLMRTGLFTALAIGIHNFPEGIATFATALSDINLGIVIAIAIALHNIPEGLSVSVPIYYATGSKRTAFKYSFLSGVAEPVGALIALLVLMPFMSDFLLSMLLAFVAGIMVYISIDEIIPTAHSYGKSHVVILGFILGMFVMAVSLLVL